VKRYQLGDGYRPCAGTAYERTVRFTGPKKLVANCACKSSGVRSSQVPICMKLQREMVKMVSTIHHRAACCASFSPSIMHDHINLPERFYCLCSFLVQLVLRGCDIELDGCHAAGLEILNRRQLPCRGDGFVAALADGFDEFSAHCRCHISSYAGTL
jgi:hypothetical protein